MTWKIEAIPPVPVSITATQGLSLYLAEEAFIVLAVTAAMLIIALLFAMAFILFSEVARFGFFWLKAKVALIAGLYHDHFAHQTPGPFKRRNSARFDKAHSKSPREFIPPFRSSGEA